MFHIPNSSAGMRAMTRTMMLRFMSTASRTWEPLRVTVFGAKANLYFDTSLGRTAFGADYRNEDIISGNLGEPLDLLF